MRSRSVRHAHRLFLRTGCAHGLRRVSRDKQAHVHGRGASCTFNLQPDGARSSSSALAPAPRSAHVHRPPAAWVGHEAVGRALRGGEGDVPSPRGPQHVAPHAPDLTSPPPPPPRLAASSSGPSHRPRRRGSSRRPGQRRAQSARRTPAGSATRRRGASVRTSPPARVPARTRASESAASQAPRRHLHRARVCNSAMYSTECSFYTKKKSPAPSGATD